MYTKVQIEQIVKEILCEQIMNPGLKAECIDLNKNIKNAFGLDSLDAVEIELICEEKFDIDISIDDFNEKITGDYIVDIIIKKLKKAKRYG